VTSSLIGYTNKWSVAPGEHLCLMVNSDDDERIRVSLVRLRHGDTNSAGPGPQHMAVAEELALEVVGKRQNTFTGSFLMIPDSAVLQLSNFSFRAVVYPTLPKRGESQGLLARWKDDRGGFALLLGANGSPEVWLGDGAETTTIGGGPPLQRGAWYLVGFSRFTTGRALLGYRKLGSRSSGMSSVAWLTSETTSVLPRHLASPLLIGGLRLIRNASKDFATGTFDGKIENPFLYAEPVDENELLAGEPPEAVLTATWDFGHDHASTTVRDMSANGLHGELVNAPMRAVTSSQWNGDAMQPREDPRQYSAIHFHSDDLEDADWEPTAGIDVPDDLASGVYAFQLENSSDTDLVPFFVRPPRGRATADVAYLLPTYTYLAYANERGLASEEINYEDLTDRTIEIDELDRLVDRHPEWGLSLYDHHADHSGSAHSSRLRPIPNLRPGYRFWLTGAPRHLSADLYLVDWLHEIGANPDIITDEDLHEEGYDLLKRYRCVLTGSHPEYWSTRMRRSLEQYLEASGRLMYLGGNGFYWVTSVHAELDHVIEVRRGQAASRCWESSPGENYHASTGELGGIWRHRGLAPNGLVGVGFAAQGSGRLSAGYQRLPDSYDPRSAFVFDGVDTGIIGDFGLVMEGAAGDELDRMDCPSCSPDLGTPRHCLALATSAGRHTDFYLLAHEHQLISTLDIGGESNNGVRADMVFFETPSGGAVFSVGSINWMGSLSHNNYTNNVAKITDNVLKRFLDPEPFSCLIGSTMAPGGRSKPTHPAWHKMS
jgi:N,N-dimethylformamidase